jgi:AraC-like DNA-binding protein
MLKATTLILLTPFFVTLFWLVALLLNRNKYNSSKNKLAFFMFCGMVAFLSAIALFGKYYVLYRVIYAPVVFFAMSLFPSFYIYIHSLTDEKGFSLKSLFHYIIPVIGTVIAAYIHLFWLSPEEGQTFVSKVILGIPVDNTKLKFAFYIDRMSKNSAIVMGFFYYWLTNKRVKEHRIKIENYFSNTENISLKWIKVFNITFLLTLASGVFFHSLNRSVFITHEWMLVFPFIPLTVFFWVIGYFGNLQIGIYPQNEIVLQPEIDSLNKKLTNVLNIRLNKAFEVEIVYLNPNLTLPGLARELGTNRSYLSKLINKEHQLNFNQFVNKHRVEEAAKMMESEDFKNLTVKDIGERCGFSNHNSFIRWFKEYFNSTPGDFRKEETEK